MSPSLATGNNHTVFIVSGRDGEFPTLFVSSTLGTPLEVEQFEARIEQMLTAVNTRPELLKEIAALRRKSPLPLLLASAIEMHDILRKLYRGESVAGTVLDAIDSAQVAIKQAGGQIKADVAKAGGAA